MGTRVEITPEQAARGLANAAVKKAAMREAARSLRKRYADMPEWVRLASEAGIRLPEGWLPLTTAAMEKWLHILDIPTEAYVLWNGAGLDGTDGSAKLGDFIVRNPDWTLRAWSGLILEHRELILRQHAPSKEPRP